jgi:two-component system response regulator YesN
VEPPWIFFYQYIWRNRQMYNVILIDDEIVSLSAMEHRINWKKYNVEQVYKASSMMQAQKLFQQHNIDIMFCDIEMPQGNGLELFEWVKGFFPYVECVYVTCHPDYNYMRKALKLGSFDYILKPIEEENVDDIFPALAQRIERWRSRNGHYQNGQTIPIDLDYQIETGTNGQMEIYVEKVCEYIRDNLENQISINDIAEQIHVSPGYLMRIFRKTKDCSVVEYITDSRIEWAKKLLKTTTKSVHEVAETVGYPNYTYFSRVFKRLTDFSPKEYREYRKR